MNNNAPKSSKKTLVGVVVIIILAAIGYFYYEGTIPSAGSNLSVSTEDQQVGAQVLALLNQISTIHIDTTLFADAGYRTLQDFTVSIPAQNVGRPNPFAPIPGEPVNSSGQNGNH